MGVDNQDKSLFNYNFFTLFKGSFISQLIPLLISPLITRLYSPSELGVLALFVAITSILGSVVNGRYEQAIMLVKTDLEINLITFLSLFVSFVFSLVLALFLVLFHDSLILFFELPNLSKWIYFIPLVVFSIAAFNTFNFYQLRQKELRYISISEVYKSSVFSLIQLLYPIFQSGVGGLLIGKIISSLIAPFYLFRKSNFNISLINFNQLFQLSKRYINFPKYTSPAILLNNLGSNGIQLLIPVLYSTTTLGFYSLMNKVLSAPFSFIGNSISQAFLKEISNDTKTAYVVTKSILYKLLLIALFGYGISFFFIEDLFQFIYGDQWRLAGTFAKYLIPYFIFKFIASPLTSIHTAFEKQRLSLLLQFIMFVLSVGILFYSYFMKLDFEQFLLSFSVLLSLFYIVRILIIINISKSN